MQEYIDFITNNILVCFVWVALVGMLISMLHKTITAKYDFVDPQEVIRLMNRDEAVVIDIRVREDFRSGHITDSINVSNKDILTNNLTDSVSKYKDSPVIVVCNNGQDAMKAANKLIEDGFIDVKVLKNGLLAWSKTNIPLVQGKK